MLTGSGNQPRISIRTEEKPLSSCSVVKPSSTMALPTLFGVSSKFADGSRITLTENMPAIEQAVGQVRMRIEAQLSMGLPNTPMADASIRVVSGNFITAQPHGIHNGIDFCQTGNVRNVDAATIKQQLENNNVTLISPIGYSPTGEVFNLRAEDVATETAIALNADKLIFVMESNGVTDKNGGLQQQLDLPQAENWLKHHDAKDKTDIDTQTHLNNAAHACRGGVQRHPSMTSAASWN